ncbi:hypothetical protein ONS95_014250 [Cadophora gregata]|uniref:uncharacterized protein n=1 Tax=Cadophora gregata TaxID=51156 RepID=UPI0026DBD7BC|nr:uncharacterized protein ONS95_014250 [Cadophora gregata]KAK0114007.1 hypothetical protein ONS96_014854 [Cadophora gregata f. sp. sojae]KAK0114766.1 hypothetical protein ONS95_014250 [Cadophora gregata]
MSADLPSSNPFRRKTPSTLPSAMSQHPTADIQISSPYENIQSGAVGIEQTALPKKIAKKVRVQSPPPPSPSTPSIPDSSSTIGDDSYKTPGRPPSPPKPRADDPFDSVNSDTSEDEGSNKPTKAPANPFSKTLETMENPEREFPAAHPPNTAAAGRASMDVEAFKRLLMTGNAGLGTPPAQPSAPAHVAHAVGDGGSSTDTSSISRQSIFEAVQEPLPESPRTSHEISEPEDDRRLISEPSAAPRKKPPPPSSRHGKLIKVELRDEGTPNALQSPPTPGSITSQNYFSSSPRSQTDLNKPLPPAPPRASHESERESVFDKESAGKTPEPPSPSTSIRKKNPPAPPLSRRHSQMVSGLKLTRSNSARLSLKPEEELPRIPLQENRRPSIDSVRAPPPPPSRRLGAARGTSHTTLTSQSTASLPAPPPARGSSRSLSGGKPPSVLSLDLTSPNPPNKRASVMAPPPPPPRHGRSSMDAQSPGNSQRPSGEYSRRSNESARRGSNFSSGQPEKATEPANKHDILADLSKLQREIDALRQNETGRIT